MLPLNLSVAVQVLINAMANAGQIVLLIRYSSAKLQEVHVVQIPIIAQPTHPIVAMASAGQSVMLIKYSSVILLWEAHALQTLTIAQPMLLIAAMASAGHAEQVKNLYVISL